MQGRVCRVLWLQNHPERMMKRGILPRLSVEGGHTSSFACIFRFSALLLWSYQFKDCRVRGFLACLLLWRFGNKNWYIYVPIDTRTFLFTNRTGQFANWGRFPNRTKYVNSPRSCSRIPWIVTVPGPYGPPAQPPHHTSKNAHQRPSFLSSLL
jgi:hypothetical protein